LRLSENLIEVVRFLVEAGADLEASDVEYRRSPLHEAALKCHVDLVKFLVEI
jgi:ankyrin repeat protein